MENSKKHFIQKNILPPDMKPKYYYCCVPGCATYDIAANFLHFPMDSNWRQQWLQAVPMQNWLIDQNTVLCLKHFKQNEVALYTRLKDETGQVRTIRNYCPLLKEGAIPTIFPPVFIEKNDCMYLPEVMFKITYRDQCPQTFGDLENVKDPKDYLIDYHYLKIFYSEKLKEYLQIWNVFVSARYILFYLLDLRYIPKVYTSIKIDSALKVTITLDGREMDILDLTWIIPVTRKINRWSQLQLLLRHFQKGCFK